MVDFDQSSSGKGCALNIAGRFAPARVAYLLISCINQRLSTAAHAGKLYRVNYAGLLSRFDALII